MIVEPNRVLDESFTVGTLGLINGVLNALGLTRVAMSFTDTEPPRFVGFVPYNPPSDADSDE